jgi:hypothetical protein
MYRLNGCKVPERINMLFYALFRLLSRDAIVNDNSTYQKHKLLNIFSLPPPPSNGQLALNNDM